MATKFVTNLDLNQNQILNGRFQVLAEDPLTGNFNGRVYFNSAEGTLKYYYIPVGSGSGTWRKIVRGIASGTAALTATEADGNYSLSIANASTTVAGLLSATDKAKLDDSTASNVANKLVQRNANGDFSAGTISANLTGNVTGDLTGDVTGQVSDISNHDTDDLAEGDDNLYFTDLRVRANRLDQMTSPLANVSFNGQRITGLAEPQDPQDAATKNYVDAARSGLDVKESVRVVLNNNLSPLMTLPIIDGVQVQNNDRVLVRGQNIMADNGIYIAKETGPWIRATDADSDEEVGPGMFVFVEQGNDWGDSGWVLTTNRPIVLGTTSLEFTQFSSAGQSIAGNGLTKVGNTIDVVGTSDRISVTTGSVDIASTYVGQSSITTLGTISTGVWAATDVAVLHGGTGASTAADARTNLGFTAGTFSVDTPVLGRVASQTIGDGILNSYIIDHNFGTRDVNVQIYDTQTFDTVFADVVRTNTNRVTVSFTDPPLTGAYRVVVSG